MKEGESREAVRAVRERLKGRMKGAILEDVPLSGYTSFRIGGPADLLVLPKDREDLVLLTSVLVEEGCGYVVLGKGTNVLVSDAGFRGVAVVLSAGLKRLTIKYEDIVDVESGCDLNYLILRCIDYGLSGLERMAGIPGSVGGAVRMNAGAQGECMGNWVRKIRLLRPVRGMVADEEIAGRQAGFEYRKAVNLKEGDIIYQVELKLNIDDVEAIRRRRREALEWRRKRQPVEKPSAGSVFLNPPGESAGALIERCGLKGLRIGDAAVSPKHANFIVNLGKASADDVSRLIERVKEEVLRREGVELREEIVRIGFPEEG